MRFSRQPNGNWCGYSTVSDSFYESNMTQEMLLEAVIADAAAQIARRYMDLLKDGGYSFDEIIDEFRYDNDQKETRAHWERKFKLMGCNKDQMARVKQRIDELIEDGDISGLKKQED